jgi:DNA-binding transcriptional LysR family regulator
MESRFLETFLLVAELGSLAEAARRLAITPAAVAQRMQALEEEFGKRLLVRAGRVVQPTDAGHAILEQSRRVLGDIRHLKTLAQTDSPAGEMRLGAVSTALTGILAPALRHLVDAVPSVEVFVLPGTSTDLYRALGDGSIDAALLVRPPFSIQNSCSQRDPSSGMTATIGVAGWPTSGCAARSFGPGSGWSWIHWKP